MNVTVVVLRNHSAAVLPCSYLECVESVTSAAGSRETDGKCLPLIPVQLL